MTATTSATPAATIRARVVLIEDNPADVLLVREAIRERGLTVELISYADVPDAIDGLDDPGNPLPDAILMDLNLPRGEGMTIIGKLRASERLRGVPLAILTSSQSPRDREQAQRLDVQWYIHKPSTLDEFLSTVGDAVGELLDSSPRFRKP
jgi:CheY-like chemotaxis protein